MKYNFNNINGHFESAFEPAIPQGFNSTSATRQSAAAVIFGVYLSARLALGEMTGNRLQPASFHTATIV